MQAFVRQLGSQTGVQLDPTLDESDGLSLDNQDQIFATVGHFPRGRIDKPFAVDRSTLRRYLGINGSLRSSLLNECYEQVYEALQNGAYQGVISRLSTPDAAISWALFNAPVTPAPVPAASAVAQATASLYVPMATTAGLTVGQVVSGTSVVLGSTVAAVAAGTAPLTPTAAKAVAAGQTLLPLSSSIGLVAGMLVKDTTTAGVIPTDTVVVSVGTPVAASVTGAANAPTASGNAVLHLASTVGIVNGMAVVDTTTAGAIAPGATVLSTTVNTVTMSLPAIGGGVLNTDSLTFYPAVVLSTPVAAGGVVNADALAFYPTVKLSVPTSAPIGAAAPLTFTTLPSAVWSVGDTAEPETGYMVAVQHLGCYNDGIILDIHADAAVDPLTLQPVASSMVTLNVYDPVSGQAILTAYGSLDADSVDVFGNTDYLPDIVQALTDEFVVKVYVGSTIQPDSPAYGLASDGSYNTSTSDLLVCFQENGTGYLGSDYDRSIAALKYSDLDFGYILGGGTRAPALIQKMVSLGYDTNRLPRFDVPGDLIPSAAVAWVNQLNVDSEYVHFFWSPLIATLPSSSGVGLVGTAGLNIGFACARNAVRDANGFAQKNYPIAGPNYAINRTGIKQIYTPSEQELSLLADAKITPVIYNRFNGGGKYVYTDCLTARKVQNSLLKLTTVAEMKSEIDDAVTRQAKELVLLPFTAFNTQMSNFLDTLFANAQAAQWLVPSTKLTGNVAFIYKITRSTVNFADKVLITYYCCYDGVVRQAECQQILTR